MSIDDIYSKPLVLEDLLHFKALEPLSASSLEELDKLQKRDVSGLNEQEVRTFFIDPLVRLLGYDNGSDFSVDLGRQIEYLDKRKFPDYNFHLWKEHFWLIEAKRPLSENKGSFGYDALAQAVEYAIHPNINAALVVLCDGNSLEIFDREVSLTEPILHVDKTNLRRDFDKIRALLEPMQVWFFQKRRVVRLIDKVFDKEFNFNRVEEFRTLIDRRLLSKRSTVLENFRRNLPSNQQNSAEEQQYYSSASTEELVDLHFFYSHSEPANHTIIDILVARCETATFPVLYRMFPDHPRDINDMYMANASAFLAALGERRTQVEWLPAWIAPGKQSSATLEEVTQRLLRQCLTCFEDDLPRKVIILASASFRRIFKILFLSNEAQWQKGLVMHFFGRYSIPELSWSQILSSPQNHLITMMDNAVMAAMNRFMERCQPERKEFKTEVAKLHLKELWDLEKKLLASIDDYPKLNRERNLGEGRMTEWAELNYDNLGHYTLCLLASFPKWMEYVKTVHRPLLETIAATGSWKAKELLDLQSTDAVDRLPDALLAERFFFGDLNTFQTLRNGYTNSK